jgi:hypothetical protein
VVPDAGETTGDLVRDMIAMLTWMCAAGTGGGARGTG